MFLESARYILLVGVPLEPSPLQAIHLHCRRGFRLRDGTNGTSQPSRSARAEDNVDEDVSNATMITSPKVDDLWGEAEVSVVTSWRAECYIVCGVWRRWAYFLGGPAKTLLMNSGKHQIAGWNPLLWDHPLFTTEIHRLIQRHLAVENALIQLFQQKGQFSLRKRKS